MALGEDDGAGAESERAGSQTRLVYPQADVVAYLRAGADGEGDATVDIGALVQHGGRIDLRGAPAHGSGAQAVEPAPVRTQAMQVWQGKEQAADGEREGVFVHVPGRTGGAG